MSRAGRRRRLPWSRRQSDVDGAPECSLPPPTRRTFLLLEVHRPAKAIELTPKGWRRSRRYESLLLAAAVSRLQRDCLALTDDSEWVARGGKRVLLQGVWLSLRRLAAQLEASARRLTPGARRRAEARARARFEAICRAVATDLRRAGELATPGEPDRCTATTRRGTRCAHPARTNGLCAVHHRLAAATAPTAIAASTAIARRMEHSAGLLATSTARGHVLGPRTPTKGRNMLSGGLERLRHAVLPASAPRLRLAARLHFELGAHRQTASTAAGFAVAAVLFGLTGLPLGGPGGGGGGYPGSGIIGVEGADASNPGLEAAEPPRDAAGALASHRSPSNAKLRGRARGLEEGSAHGRAGGGIRGRASRLVSSGSPTGHGSPSGGSVGTTPGSGPTPAPSPSPGPSPAPGPAPSPTPSPSPPPQPSPSPQPTGTVTRTVNTVRQGASQATNGVTRTVQGTAGHATSGVGQVVGGS